MAAVLLSQHSSNPLELPSSDPRGRAYLRQTQKLERGEIQSSDDPMGGYHRPEIEEYRNHIAELFPALVASHSKASGPKDPEVSSRDELDVVMRADDYDSDAEDDDGDGDTDAQGDTDEEMTIYLKSQEEREEIEEEISDLEDAVPRLAEDYKLIDRLGTGTFSSVYKAIDLGYHTKWDNSPWHGLHPPSSSAHHQSIRLPLETKAFVAVKRIYVTSNPERIRNEIEIMLDCRGCRHVAQFMTAFRHEDQVVVIMPYHRNDDFRDYYNKLSMAGIKAYFRCMFRALRDIHSRGIIHRDVKPANFLFDPRRGTGILCDFGLASRMEPGPVLGTCLHTSATREYPHGQIRPRAEYDIEHIKKMQKEARQKSLWPSEKVGYPEKDTRPVSKANRAGTRGFRAPEVLLKCGDQTGAVDVWAAGMILLFFLVRKFPLFQSNDDVEALMEIATIVGRRRMEKAATLHSRTFATNVPSVVQEGISWRAFIEKQNPDVKTPREPDPQFFPYFSNTNEQDSSKNSCRAGSRSDSPHAGSQDSQTMETFAAELEHAFDLLEQLMQPESTRRISPRGALYHPFLAEVPEDDEFFPHPFGEGLCGEWHFMDPVTEERCVKIGLGNGNVEVKRLTTGQGIAIGRHPCEFHTEDFP